MSHNEMIEKCLTQIEGKTTDLAEEEFFQLVDVYVSENHLEKEQRTLFRNFPICIGHTAQIPNPGDALVHDDLGLPILVVRNEEGGLEAFLNVCRHRGARLVKESTRCEHDRIVCPYHSWCYRTNGELSAIPNKEGFRNINWNEYGLVRIPIASRFGLIFVRPLAQPFSPIDLDAFLAPIHDDLAELDLHRHHVYRSRKTVVRMNWKLALDGSIEGYHIPAVHRKTAAPVFLNNQGVFEARREHLKFFLAKRTFPRLRDHVVLQRRLRDHVLLAYVIFPCTIVECLSDVIGLHHIFPLGPERCVYYNTMLIPEPVDGDAQEQYLKSHYQLMCSVFSEDFEVGEGVQRGIASGANRSFVFGRFEKGPIHMHSLFERAIRGELTSAG